MKLKLQSVFILFIFLSLNGISQSKFPVEAENRFSDLNRWISTYPSHIISGTENAFLKNENPYKFITGAAVILIMSNYDDNIRGDVYHKPFFSHGLSRDADNFGKTFGWGYFAGVGLITCESFISKDSQSQYFSKIELVLESIAVTQVITQTLKTTVKRERPNFSDNHSFPSGHTSSVFALATSLNGIYGWKAGIPAYIIALTVGAQRISSSSHYLTDVLSGALIGYLVADGFSKIHIDESPVDEKQSNASSFLLLPSVWYYAPNSSKGLQLTLFF
jgi:hypothetical protein